MALNNPFELDPTGPTSNSNYGGANIKEGCAPSGINNALRHLGTMIAAATAYKSPSMSASVSCNIAAVTTGLVVPIVGTGPINSFGTVPGANPAAAVMRLLQFQTSCSISSGTAIILRGGISRKTKPGEILAVFHDHATADVWREWPNDSSVGVHMIPVPAQSMFPATTNGAAPAINEATTNKTGYRSLDFDTTTQEFACFHWTMPPSWNEGTITFRAHWTAASGSGGVAWALQGVACSDDDTLDVAYGTEQVVTDTLITAGDDHRTDESSAITIAGSPAAGDQVLFRVKRVPANGSDTLGVDAKLLGIELYVTVDSENDA